MVSKLTNLQNRYSLLNYLESLKKRGQLFNIFFIDLDNFKTINDSLGHNTGDEVLCRTAQVLQSLGDEGITVGRLGGDEFLVIMRYCADQDVGEAIKRLKAVTSSIRFTDAEELTIVINAGYSYTDVFDGGTEQIRGLLDSADGCMYKDKI